MAASTKRRRHELGRAEPEDRRAHGPEPHRAKLEPDHEQQHDDAELAEMQDALDTVELVERPENIRADDHAGGEIAEHGAHAKNAAERCGNGSGGEKHRHLDQLRRNHRFSLYFSLPYHALTRPHQIWTRDASIARVASCDQSHYHAAHWGHLLRPPHRIRPSAAP